MTRVTSVLLAATGLLLLVTWLVSSVSSAPQRSAPVSPLVAPSIPELEEINRELDRLSERIAPHRDRAIVRRDPFRFGATNDLVGDEFDTTPSGVTTDLLPPVVAWPTLVAILSSGDESAPTLQAVFEDAGQIVRVVSQGDTLGDFVVTRITPDEVVIASRSIDRSTRLSIR